MLLFEVVGRVGVMTLDRHESRNAIDGETAAQIERRIDEIESEDSLWVGIIAGRPPAFCSGADLKATQRGSGKSMFTKKGGFAGVTARQRTKPLIAAVDGAALAGGTEIALACDMIVASRRSSFGLPEVKRSLLASAGGVFRLPRKIPSNIAMECILTGAPLSAQRAYDLGLINRLAEDGEALQVAICLADEVCQGAPIAVRQSRQAAIATALADDEAAWQISRQALRVTTNTEDYREGLEAFAQKRSPDWRGR